MVSAAATWLKALVANIREIGYHVAADGDIFGVSQRYPVALLLQGFR